MWVLSTLIVFLSFYLIFPISQVQACGWWGDGEVQRDSLASPLAAPDGTPLEQSLSLKSAKLPGAMGYGIAVPDPGRAVPYLLETFGRPVNRIGDLKSYGFETVIDLGTPDKIAHLHRAETEAVRMVYFNIPIAGDMPSQKQVEQFKNMIVGSSHAPILVYAPTSKLLGAMWAAYRLRLGSPKTFALQEGRNLGLTVNQEKELLQLFE